MITLAAADTFQGNAGTAAVITYTLSGMELAAGVETYKTLAQGQLSTGGPAILYTVPGSTQAFIKTIHLANTSGVSVSSVKLFLGGGAAGNQLTSLTIPANGEAVFGPDGWHVYDVNGAVLTSTATGGASKNYSARVFARANWK